ncbi:hypothetical protein DDE82_006980 [Stemphylium lycopersici]|nr:hypothetical protein TW65_04312 [Stemphylium lycopersici]RAR00789.1 hypothetical protein DDE82_006980 [Stemphylium lycopersici]
MSTHSTNFDSNATLPGPDYTSSTASDRREESSTSSKPETPRFGMFGSVAPTHTRQEMDAARTMLELRNLVFHGANSPGGKTDGPPGSSSGPGSDPETETGYGSGTGTENATSGSAQISAAISSSAPRGNTSTTSNPAATSLFIPANTTTPTNDDTPTVTKTSPSTTNPVTANPPASTNNLASIKPTNVTAPTGNSTTLPAAGLAASQGSKTITVSQYHAMMRARAARR